MVTLAFDTATAMATVALLRDDDVLGERQTRAVKLLEDVEELLAAAGLAASDIDRLAVGVGPGSYTSLRMGLVTARMLAFSLDVPAAGIPTLDALAAGSPGAVPVIDARRGEVFARTREGDPAAVAPEALALQAGAVCVGDGAIRFREVLEAAGATVPPDDDGAHVPWARLHAALATDFGPAERLEPLYLRVPDAEARLAG